MAELIDLIVLIHNGPPLWNKSIKSIKSIKSKVFLCQNGPRDRCELTQLKQVKQLNQLNREVADLIDLIVLSHNGPRCELNHLIQLDSKKLFVPKLSREQLLIRSIRAIQTI